MEEKLKIQLPEAVAYIIKELERNGFEAFAVGGCVRDSLLNKKPKDWDITTSAFPEDVKKIFPRTIDTGIIHGTVTVMLKKVGYEVTTYRIDGKYEDGRHPREVIFTRSLEEDLKRRDFTINAMAYNNQRGLVDLFHGKDDLNMRRICCVGDAVERFTEDALRMLRAIRFEAQLGFSTEENTWDAICSLASRLQFISKERIQVELNKILLSDYPEKIEKVFQGGLSKWALPEMEQLQNTSMLFYCIRMLKNSEPESIQRWSLFLLCMKERMAVENILRTLRFDNHTITFVSRLTEAFFIELSEKKSDLRKQIVQIGTDIFPRLIKLKIIMDEEEKTNIEKIKEKYQEIIEAGDCLSIRDLKVNGRDLIQAGIKPGKGLGETLEKLLDLVLEEPGRNNREYLLAWIKEKAL